MCTNCWLYEYVCICVSVGVIRYFLTLKHTYITSAKVNTKNKHHLFELSHLCVLTCWHPCVPLMRVSLWSIIQHTCFFSFLYYCSKICGFERSVCTQLIFWYAVNNELGQYNSNIHLRYVTYNSSILRFIGSNNY